MTVCHYARKGRYIGSHWPNHVRASALLGEISVSLRPVGPGVAGADFGDVLVNGGNHEVCSGR